MKFQLENHNKLGRPGITYKDVEKAMLQLIKEKRNPTLSEIKKILGHGGVTTISQYRAKFLLTHSFGKKSTDYLNGYRDAMKAMKVFIQDNSK